MAIDSNHVTKLGELKRLINGLWEKIKITFSAIGHTHTKSDVTDFPTNVSAFINDEGYITEATVPQYELTADKIAAVGDLSNNTSGTAQFANNASTVANGGVFRNSVPSGNASFNANSTGYKSKSHSISLFAEDGTSGVCGGLSFDDTDILEVDADGNVQLNGISERARRVIGYSAGNSSLKTYGFKVAEITYTSSTDMIGFDALGVLSKLGSNARVTFIMSVRVRGSNVVLSGRIVSGNGWSSDEVPIKVSVVAVTNGYYVYVEHPGIIYAQLNLTPFAQRSGGGSISYGVSVMTQALSGQASTYSILQLVNSVYKTQTGSTSKPVYVSADGGIYACNFAIVIGSTGTDTSTLYFV